MTSKTWTSPHLDMRCSEAPFRLEGRFSHLWTVPQNRLAAVVMQAAGKAIGRQGLAEGDG